MEDGKDKNDEQVLELSFDKSASLDIGENYQVHHAKPTRLLLLLVVVSSMSHFMFGYDTGYISSALVSIKGDLTGSQLTYGQQEFITSATSLGAFIGAMVCGTLADLLGRKNVTIFANLFLIVGAATQTGAQNLWTMIVGRFIMGWGVGIGSVISPLYITELSPARYRGRLVITASIIRTGAQLISYGIGAGLEHVHDGWRILVGIAMIPPFLQMFLIWPLPDSPRYLVQKGKIEEARAALEKTHNGVSDMGLDQKVSELVESTRELFPNVPYWKRAWLKLRILHEDPANFRGLIIVCAGQGINQFTGFNSLMYFSATIFEMVGFSNSTAVSIVVAAASFIFTVVVFLLIDVVGRRKLMIVSLAGMVVALVIEAIAFHFMDIRFENNSAIVGSHSATDTWGIVILVFIIVYVSFYAVGVGAIPWQQSELFPMSVRGLGSSFACGTNWAGSLTIASTFLTMMKNITPTGTFAFYAAISAVSLVFVLFCFPELSNLSLEQTQNVLADGFNIRKSIALSKAAKRKHY